MGDVLRAHLYRTLLKGSAFRTFSESEVRLLLRTWEPLAVESDGNRFWITKRLREPVHCRP